MILSPPPPAWGIVSLCSAERCGLQWDGQLGAARKGRRTGHCRTYGNRLFFWRISAQGRRQQLGAPRFVPRCPSDFGYTGCVNPVRVLSFAGVAVEAHSAEYFFGIERYS